MNTQTRSNSPDIYSILSQTQRLRVSDGEIKPVLDGCSNTSKLLILIWSQLGDFDNLEYAWWLQREKEKIQARGITIRAIGIGNRNSGVKFCEYTGFPTEWLFVDPIAEILK
ncbi:AhpC/TSA family protein, partial [Nostoc sp. PA-18-2419]|uniref:AhpC/TSA family protein n=1 Tax=Nostoc sp. PA-18-2419 TaxID=2575443 RepID=UPI00167B6ED3